MRGTQVGLDLFILNRALETRAFSAVVGAGHRDITLAQARLLARVADGGSRLVDLAAQARVAKQSASHLVDQLEASGYVERVPDPTDGRARLVRLTARARAVVPVADAAVARALEEWGREVGAEAMDALAASLSRLAAIEDPYAP